MIRTAAVALREKLRKYKGTLPGIHKLWTIITIIYLWTFYSTKTNPYLFKQLLVVFSVTCSLLPWLPPGDLPNPGIEPRSPALQVESLLSEPPASKNTGVDSLFSRGSPQPRNWTQVSFIAGWFFTSWATRETQPAVYCIPNCLSNSPHFLEGGEPPPYYSYCFYYLQSESKAL